MNSDRWLSASLAAALMCAAFGPMNAQAQTNLAGSWTSGFYQDWQVRAPGPDVVDYTGMPINEEARAVALNYSADQIAMPERQCLKYAPDYLVTGGGTFTMWPDYDPLTGKVIAWNVSAGGYDRAPLKIWMDGRPRPSRYANHQEGGFTTGVWQGDILTTTTTDMKRGYLRRNGVPVSAQATLTIHFIKHGNLLTTTGEIDDPIYTTRSYILSQVSVQAATESSIPGKPQVQCSPTVEVAGYANIGTVPNWLPGSNPSVNDETERLHIPQIAAMGGAETMYPEFRKRLQAQYVAPAKCTLFCCDWEPASKAAATLPGCPTWFVVPPRPGQVFPRPPEPITP